MHRMILIVVWLLFLSRVNPARADFILSTDPTTFVSNSLESWDGPVLGGSFPRNEGFGVFSSSFNAVSVPFNQTLGGTSFGSLFIGVSSSPIPGNPQFPGGTAFYNVIGTFAPGSNLVYGFGFTVVQASLGTQFRVFDIQNGVADFPLSVSLGASRFIGISSDVPISGFQISNRVTDSTAILNVNEVRINAAVPAPAGLTCALIGVLGLGGYSRRWRKAQPR
jgi:hypothetical protein